MMTGDTTVRLLNAAKFAFPFALCVLVVLLIVAEHDESGWLPTNGFLSISAYNSSGLVLSREGCGCRYLYRNKSHTRDNNTRYADVLFQGRIGNLLFQYAALYCVSRTNGLVPLIHKHAELTKFLPELDAQLSPSKEPGKGFKGFAEINSMMYDNRTLHFYLDDQDRHLFGFYQSWKYCHPYRQEIRQQFVFNVAIRSKADAFLRSVREMYGYSTYAADGTVTYIGLHVRRGDFIRDDKAPLGYMAVDDSYVKKAIKHFSHLFKNAVFVVCTDDASWAKEHVKPESGGKEPIVFSPFREAELDMCLMSKCNHTIMSTGTFGWWGAWLANGKTVYPQKFPEPDSWLGKQCKREDYYMPHWKAL